MSVANWLTLLRILLIPVFVSSLIYRRMDWGLAAFLLAAVTDMLDGFVARRTRVTTLGSFLDPTADKLLLASAFVLLPIVSDFFPVWITVVVVSRDVIIALGYMVVYIQWGSGRIQVRPLGKLTTLLQSCCVAAILLHLIFSISEQASLYLAYATAAVTAISGTEYIIRGFLYVNELQKKQKI